jgi:ribokinase
MLGQIGGDAWGRRYRQVFQEEGVDEGAVRAAQGSSTGIALIEVAASGENGILIIPGAKGAVEAATPTLSQVEDFLRQR